MVLNAIFNLLAEKWLPVKRGNGSFDWIAPHQLTEHIADPELRVVSLFAPRPDFNGALHEFLIGLLATCCMREDAEDWEEYWDAPPSPEWLAGKFSVYADAFNLDGSGPKFLQDFDELDAEPISISNLLIGEPGGNTINLNKDLFQKRERITVLSRAAAAMALFTMQCYAPPGGTGHRTSLRGVGPLTTLVLPSGDEGKSTLWHKLWANVETLEDLNNRNSKRYETAEAPRFPWLAPTRSSNPKDKGVTVTPSDVHPLQIYWGTPRRIKLIFEPAEGRRCDITGVADSVVVSSYRTKNYGVEYYESWDHPLSPHSQRKAEAPKLPVKGQGDSLSYRYWLGLTLGVKPEEGSKKEVFFPATCIKTFMKRMDIEGPIAFRLHCFGYDMEKAKARSWIESTLPAYGVQESERAVVAGKVQNLLDAAMVSADALYGAVKTAGEPTGGLKDRFWRETERWFFDAVKLTILGGKSEDQDWNAVLQRYTLGIFDDLVSMEGIEEKRMADLIRARYTLVQTFRGRNKNGKKLYIALGKPIPPKRRKKDKAA